MNRRYVALITGKGDGCDYTIDCNKTFLVFMALDELDAISQCYAKWREYKDSESSIDEIQLFVVESEISVPILKWVAGDNQEEKERLQDELEAIEERKKEICSMLKKEV